jgi:hypothetical protein
MNPELFLEQKDVAPLMLALNQFALKVNDASERQEVLESAGVDIALLSNLKLGATPTKFAPALVAAFKIYPISNQRLDYHPMVNLLKYLCELAPLYGLADQNVALFSRLVEQGQENFKALAARNAVGRIESPKGQGIGTGVLNLVFLFALFGNIFKLHYLDIGKEVINDLLAELLRNLQARLAEVSSPFLTGVSD